MDKLSIIGLESDKDKLLRDLMDQGTVELIDQSDRLQQEDWAAIVQKDGEEDRVSRVESQLSEVQTALDAIERYDTSKKPLFNTRKAVSQSAYDTKLSGREHIRSEVSRILDLHNQWNDLKSEENGIVSDQASLKPWATYELPLDQTGTRYVRTMCGILPIVANVQEMEREDRSRQRSDAGDDPQQRHGAAVYQRSLYAGGRRSHCGRYEVLRLYDGLLQGHEGNGKGERGAPDAQSWQRFREKRRTWSRSLRRLSPRRKICNIITTV